MLNKKRNLESFDNIPLNKETKKSKINNENVELNNNNNFENTQIKCEICGRNILKIEENDHYICHELQGDLEFKLYNNYQYNLHINGNFDKDDELLIKNSNYPITYTLKNIEKIPQNNKNCSICLSQFNNDDDLMILPCMHFFHERCINKWFVKEKICPFCKMNFFEEKNENINNESGNENNSENNVEESENNDEESENNDEESENNNEESENNNEENENNNEENENNNEENENKESENNDEENVNNNNEENENKESENNEEERENINEENENNEEENENKESENNDEENVNNNEEEIEINNNEESENN